MLSVTLPPLEGHEIGSHPLVKRLLRACYINRPPQPKYAATWDPAIVLQFAASSPSADLTLPVLSSKPCTLIALATMLRAAEIASIAGHTIAFSAESVTLTLTKPRKAQHSGALRSVELRSWDHADQCPVSCLRQ